MQKLSSFGRGKKIRPKKSLITPLLNCTKPFNYLTRKGQKALVTVIIVQNEIM